MPRKKKNVSEEVKTENTFMNTPEAADSAEKPKEPVKKKTVKKPVVKEKSVKKASAKKPVVKAEPTKKAVEKAAPAKKAVEKVTPAKKLTEKTTPEHIFEVEGDQISIAAIEEKVLDAYKASGHRVGRIRSLKIYYNFAERRAYYVANDKDESSFIEF